MCVASGVSITRTISNSIEQNAKDVHVKEISIRGRSDNAISLSSSTVKG